MVSDYECGGGGGGMETEKEKPHKAMWGIISVPVSAEHGWRFA